MDPQHLYGKFYSKIKKIETKEISQLTDEISNKTRMITKVQI